MSEHDSNTTISSKNSRNFNNYIDTHAKEINNDLKYELMPPEKKYHTNKIKASKNIVNYLHTLMVKIAPMSKKQIKNVKLNNQLIDSILAVFKSNSANYLYEACPDNNMGSTVFYLQYDDIYTDDAGIETTELANSNHTTRKDFLFTKHASAEFNRLQKLGYKYVHCYEKTTWKPVMLGNTKITEDDKWISTQFNAPTKRDLFNMIRHIMYDVSLYNIYNSDKFAIKDYSSYLKSKYKRAVNTVKNDSALMNKNKKRLAEMKKLFKESKQPDK